MSSWTSYSFSNSQFRSYTRLETPIRFVGVSSYYHENRPLSFVTPLSKVSSTSDFFILAWSALKKGSPDPGGSCQHVRQLKSASSKFLDVPSFTNLTEANITLGQASEGYLDILCHPKLVTMPPNTCFLLFISCVLCKPFIFQRRPAPPTWTVASCLAFK